MFKRLYIVERRFPLPEKANFRDICSFAVLGLRSRLMIGAVLFFTRNFLETLEPIICKTKDGVSLSLGIVLLTATIPGLILKLVSDKIPPFITARMIVSVILSTIGSFFVAWGRTPFTTLFGIGTLSYSFALRETTYIQYTAYFKPAWSLGNIISDCLHGIVMLICMQIGDLEKVMLIYLLAPLLEVLADLFIKRPVDVRVKVIERPEDDIDVKSTDLNFWTPAQRKVQFKNMRLFWRPALCHGLVVWMSMFNLQGTFETLSLEGYSSQLAYHYLYSIYCAGSLLGAGIALLLNTDHLWICAILETCTTTVFLMQTFCLFPPHNAITLSLAFAEGSLIKFSYVSSMIYLIRNIDHNHAYVVAFNILSLLESIFSIPAAGSAFILHKVICEYWRC